MGRIPLYYEFKLGLFLWLVLPQTRGSFVIWKTYKKEIDQVFEQLLEQLNKVQGQATVLAKEGMDKAQEKIKEKIAEVTTVVQCFLCFSYLESPQSLAVRQLQTRVVMNSMQLIRYCFFCTACKARQGRLKSSTLVRR